MATFNSYFSRKPIESKNCIFNMVLSDRSDGKTFDCKACALEEYEKSKNITVYVRRYKTEVTPKMYMTFFDEVVSKPQYAKWKKYKFKGSKAGVQISEDGKKWDWIVYFIVLTMSGKLKSQISDIERINTIDYDEFVPLDGKYLKDEMLLLMELYKSIDRDRDTTKLFILGNKVTPFNPFFDFFDLDLMIEKDKIRVYKNNTIAVQVFASKEHREVRAKSKFNFATKGTEYDDYNKGGILLAIDVKFKSREGFDYMESFMTSKGKGSIWVRGCDMVISEYERKDGPVIVDKIYNINRMQHLYNYRNIPRYFKEVYGSGHMFFETQKAFYKFEDILKKL